jgi:hypothetical protein
MSQRRRVATAAAAVATSLLVVGAAVLGVAAATRSRTRPPLVLVSGGKVVPDALLAPIGEPVPYRYRLSTPAPDLGSDAPVGRLEVPTVDAARVDAMARVLGLRGSATATHPGWRVNDGAAQLTVAPASGGWDVAYAFDAGAGAAGSVPGSTGSGASGGSGGSVGSGNAVAVPPSPPDVVPPPATLPTETTPQIPAPHLPPTAAAEQIARTLLTKLGVADASWSATAYDSAHGAVVCSPQPCATPDFLLASRVVVLRPVFHSLAVDGLSWQVEIGDNGKIYSASGLWTNVHMIGQYPLHSVAAVFADLVAGVGGSTSPQPMPAREAVGIAPGAPPAPVTVTIDRVMLGFAAVPASADGSAVVDIVPTYVFAGRTSAGDPVTQMMVAVVASAAPPPTVVPMSGAGRDKP